MSHSLKGLIAGPLMELNDALVLHFEEAPARDVLGESLFALREKGTGRSLVLLALLADVLRVVEAAAPDDPEADDELVVFAADFLQVAARTFAKKGLSRYAAFGSGSSDDAAGLIAFHRDDSGTFGGSNERTHWGGLAVCRNVARLFDDPAVLDRYESVLSGLADALLPLCEGAVEQTERLERVRAFIAESCDAAARPPARGEADFEARQAALDAERAALADERGGLAEERAALDQERDALAEQRAAVEAEQAEWTGRRAALETELAELSAQRDAIEAERADLAEERAALEAERAGLAEQRAAVEAEQAEWSEQRAAMDGNLAELTELNEQRASVSADRAELTEQRAELEAERADLGEQRAALEAELGDQFAALEAERAELTEQRAAVAADRVELTEQQATIESARADLDEQRAAVEAERAALTEERAAVELDRTDLDEQRAALETARADLNEQRASVEAARREWAEQSRLDQIAAGEAALAREREQLRTEQGFLDAAQHELAGARQQLQDAAADLERRQTDVRSESTRLQVEAARLQSEAQRLETERRELEAARAALAAARPPAGRAPRLGRLAAERGDDPREALLAAAVSGDLGQASEALEAGADVNSADSSRDWQTPLLLAARHGHAAVVELLLSRGANIEACDPAGRNALLLAVAGGRREVVDCLLSRADGVVRRAHRGLSAVLRDRNASDEARELALRSLASLGEPARDAVPAVIGLLQSKSRGLARAAADALARIDRTAIGGQAIPVVSYILEMPVAPGTPIDRRWVAGLYAVRGDLRRLVGQHEAAAGDYDDARRIDPEIDVPEPALHA
ncbi:MAG TPA: ankyrin repeat domain-containing protein [Planctomycetaceae bacterium]|nr:ankyrin repeat domain-containing protein [Planctomycetaceae bacterium]